MALSPESWGTGGGSGGGGLPTGWVADDPAPGSLYLNPGTLDNADGVQLFGGVPVSDPEEGNVTLGAGDDPTLGGGTIAASAGRGGGGDSASLTLEGTTGPGIGGDTAITAGSAVEPFKAGGGITLEAGVGGPDGDPGSIDITAAGAIADTDGANGGFVNLQAGDGAGPGYNGGHVLLSPGEGGAGGLAGSVQIAGNGQRVSFYGHTPTAQQTGVAVTAAGIHAALVALGLITA